MRALYHATQSFEKTGADPGFLERGEGCLLFLNSIPGKIIAKNQNIGGGGGALHIPQALP